MPRGKKKEQTEGQGEEKNQEKTTKESASASKKDAKVSAALDDLKAQRKLKQKELEEARKALDVTTQNIITTETKTALLRNTSEVVSAQRLRFPSPTHSLSHPGTSAKKQRTIIIIIIFRISFPTSLAPI